MYKIKQLRQMSGVLLCLIAFYFSLLKVSTFFPFHYEHLKSNFVWLIIPQT